MKFTVMITVFLLCLIAFTGIVSAEVGLVQVYGEGEALYDKTKVESSSLVGTRTADTYKVGDITDYQGVNRIATLMKNRNRFYPDDHCLYAEFDFVASVGGVAIGSGRGYFSRSGIFWDQKHWCYFASQALLVYNFDTYDIGTLTGAQTITMSYLYDDGWGTQALTFSGTSVTEPVTLTPPLSNRSYFYLHYLKGETAVYQDAAVPLSQSIGYDFNPVIMECDLKITRNGIYSDISVVNENGNELYADASSDDLSFTVSPCSYLDISVYAGVYSYNRTFRIPLSGEYGVLMPESPAGNVSLLASYAINTSYYRGEILGIPVIGNMSYGYLDFIDSVSDDTYAMGINLLDTLLYPIHLLNDYMCRAMDTISAVANDATNAIDVIIQPMVSIVNAIPFKVMTVFMFTLCLDILRILLAWRV